MPQMLLWKCFGVHPMVLPGPQLGFSPQNPFGFYLGIKPKHPFSGLRSSSCISSRLHVSLGKPFRLCPPQLPIPKLGRAVGPWSQCSKGTGLAAGLPLSCLAHTATTGLSRLSHAKGPAGLAPDLAQTFVSSPGIVWLTVWKDYGQ